MSGAEPAWAWTPAAGAAAGAGGRCGLQVRAPGPGTPLCLPLLGKVRRKLREREERAGLQRLGAPALGTDYLALNDDAFPPQSHALGRVTVPPCHHPPSGRTGLDDEDQAADTAGRGQRSPWDAVSPVAASSRH